MLLVRAIGHEAVPQLNMSLAAIGPPADGRRAPKVHPCKVSCRDRLRTEPVLLRAIILATAGFALVEHPLKDGQAG
ncbi:MAG: hypothetical protein D1H97_17080 [Paracoccus sp. BP8]|nr:MAG: hypothetical protein D1H97_17080 [Paracoccus sp. BP8]